MNNIITSKPVKVYNTGMIKDSSPTKTISLPEPTIWPVKEIHFANSLIERGIVNNKPITHLQLHKLMYFVYGYYLVRHNAKIGDTLFQAWDMGPVVEMIYQVMRGFGTRPITKYCEEFDPKGFILRAYVIGKDDINFHKVLDEVWDKYSHLSASQIIKATHRPGGAWSHARSGVLAHLKLEDIRNEFSDAA